MLAMTRIPSTLVNDPGSALLGQLFYDSECPFCRRQVARLQRWIGPGRIQYTPLASERAAERLGLPPAEMKSQMHFLSSDGRRFGGADALLELGRFLWWARPLAWMGRVPAITLGLRYLYRKLAERRHCFGGSCSRAGRERSKRTRTFFDLP